VDTLPISGSLRLLELAGTLVEGDAVIMPALVEETEAAATDCGAAIENPISLNVPTKMNDGLIGADQSPGGRTGVAETGVYLLIHIRYPPPPAIFQNQ
jgi:hypothetical protein